MDKQWWWAVAPANHRFIAAVFGLLLQAGLGLWAYFDTHYFFSGTQLVWTWVVTAPFLTCFFAIEAWSSWKERS